MNLINFLIIVARRLFVNFLYFNQREAMLSERSPPEGQEDPPGSSSNSSLKKLTQRSKQSAKASDDDNKSSSHGKEKKTSEKQKAAETKVMSEDELDKMDGYVSTSSSSVRKHTGSSTLVDVSTDEAVAVTMTDDDRPTSADVVDDDDDDIESSQAPADTSESEQDEEEEGGDVTMSDDDDGDMMEGSLVYTDDNEEVSQLTTDADASESRMGMSCSVSSSTSSSSSSSLTGNGAVLQHIPGVGCTSDDDLFGTADVVAGLRSAGVGLDTEDTSEGVLSDDSSTGMDESETAEGVLVSAFQRQPLPLDESFCSLGDENLEEALTEGCRAKTSIVGGNMWDQLMGGLEGSSTILQKTEQINKSDTISKDRPKTSKSSLNTASSLIKEPQTIVESFEKTISAKEIIPDVSHKTEGMNGVRLSSKDTSVNSEVTNNGVSKVIDESSIVSPHKRDDGCLMTRSAHSALSEAPSCDKTHPMTRTLSISSCGSKSGGLDMSRYDSRSDSKFSAILDSKVDCKLDSTSESVVAALDDAAREAQLQLLNLHTQLQHYKKMALRRKTRRALDAKMSPAIKHSIISLSIPLELNKPLPLSIYPLKHSDVELEDCPDCKVQAEWEETASQTCASLSSLTLIHNEASQNVLSTAIFRRPGEKLFKTFMMREGHVAGLSNTVRVVLSSHALYVLNTCPAPSLIHALPYTQAHTLVLGAYREWVVLLSRAAVEWGNAGEDKGGAGGTQVVGIQLCTADPDLAVDFVSSFELQTRRALMAVQATEMRFANEGKFLPLSCTSDMTSSVASLDHRRLSCDLQTDPGASGYTRSSESKVSTPQEWWRPPSRRRARVAGKEDDWRELSGRIERLVPGVVDAKEWEGRVLEQWLHYLLPTEVCRMSSNLCLFYYDSYLTFII